MKSELLQQLERPFEPSTITWKPGSIRKDGTAALALAYGDLRAYQERLDEVCDMGWSCAYTPWGDRIICNLTIDGITRSSTGEPDKESERGEIAGTVAEAQAFKRACAMFGLGRYLYKLPSLWVEWDADKRTFTQKGQAKLAGMLDAHYKNWLATHTTPTHRTPPVKVAVESRNEIDPITDALAKLEQHGLAAHGDNWPSFLSGWMDEQGINEMGLSEIQALIEEMDVDTITVAGAAPVNPNGKTVDGTFDLSPWAKVAASLTGGERKFCGWAMDIEGRGGAAASAKQYGLLASILDAATGKQHRAVLSVLVGRPVTHEAPITSQLASKLIDCLKSDGKNYDVKYVSAAKAIAAAVEKVLV